MPRVMYLSPNSTLAENGGGRMRCSFIATALSSCCELKVITLGDVALPGDFTRFSTPWQVAEFPVLPEKPYSKLFRLIEAGLRGRGFHTDLLCNDERWQILAAMITQFNPDVIILGNCFIAQLAQSLRKIAPSVRFVLDSHNIEWVLCNRLATSKLLARSQRLTLLIRSWLVRKIERRAMRDCDEIWAVSLKDAEGLERLGGKMVHVIPNTINLKKYQPAPLRGDGSICFMGWYSYLSNEEAALFLLECSSQLLQRGISHRLTLSGRDPTARMLARAQGMKQVEVVGDVADARAAISAADIFAVPLFSGSGTRFKILEAMALGRCVVTTPLGREGLGCLAGQDLVETEADDFVDVLSHLLANSEEAKILGNNGRKWIEKNHSPELTKQIIAEQINTLATKPKQS